MGLLQHAARTFAHLQCFSEAQEMQKNSLEKNKNAKKENVERKKLVKKI